MTDAIRIAEVELANPDDQRDVVAMTAVYAMDAMGNGAPLSAEVLDRLIPALREHPTTMILLARDGNSAVGIATCFLGFSTFAARPLMNIHDLAVLPGHRGRGIGCALLEAVELKARQRGCVKVTLEVSENNGRARGVYETAGFSQVVYGETTGGSLFYAKSL